MTERINGLRFELQAIAKQISDHAEAIYQTWKSKGLTPNQLLHLHHVTPSPASNPAPHAESDLPQGQALRHGKVSAVYGQTVAVDAVDRATQSQFQCNRIVN